ncbi:MAG TPA: molybdopterin-binding/glycosyltransferase family 2 protein [Haliangium sp.]|nr:molybdopterin-binding/glycosyltransferase family 2 protein [Haliangium sp.]
MKFGRIPVGEALGGILGHTLRLGRGQVLKKGRVLDAEDVALLHAAGQDQVFAALLDPDDVSEDEAARLVGHAIAGPGVRVAEAFTGRCNLFAGQGGVAVIDAARVLALNAVHEAITLATVAPHAALAAHDMIATVKIIPFAVSRAAVDACLQVASESRAAGGLVRMARFSRRQAGLVLTRLPGVKEAQLDRAAINLRTRIEGMGSEVAAELRCPHTEAAVADSVSALLGRGCTLVLVLGASAIVDRRDVIPLAIEAAGGVVEHFGMPVDPGNLLLLARVGAVPVLGVPGCARSLKPSGFDWVLQRLCAGLPVTRADVTAMSVGGLLADIDARPQPREPRRLPSPLAPRRPVVTAVVLAAGRSMRMGAQNKLVVDVLGTPMIGRVVDALLASSVERVVVVTGHERERVEAALAGRGVTFVHNPDYAAGMSTSLRAGIRALGPEIDAALVCLGDMPWIAPAHVDALIDAFQPVEGREICVPVYQGKRGNPVLFAARFFDAMSQLEGDMGARALIDAHAEVVFQVPVDQSGVLVDVDTVAALERLRLADGAPPGTEPRASQPAARPPGPDEQPDDEQADEPDA